jgi:ATP-binding cassette subfamily B protein
MEKEHIIKEYDPVILKKISSFTKPHAKWLVIGVLSLVIATAAELINPVIIQKTIDNYVLPH